MPLALLDDALDVVLLNAAGRQLIERQSALRLQAQRLCLADQPQPFERALRQWMDDPFQLERVWSLGEVDLLLRKMSYAQSSEAPLAHELLPSPGWGGLPFSVLLWLRERCEPTRARALAPVPEALAQWLGQQHGLSDKELNLAWGLACGMGLKQYAASTARPLETVRSQLKTLLRKLAVADQAGVARVLLRAVHALNAQALAAGLAPALGERLQSVPARAEAGGNPALRGGAPGAPALPGHKPLFPR